MNNVLIVDDDIMLLKMAEELLKEYYSVTLARSGETALEIVQSGYAPNIVLLDIDMPKMDGYETLLKLHKINRDIPVIFLTGLTETEFELKGLLSGAVDYVTKPFVKEILLARLKVHIDNSKKSRDFDPDKMQKLALILNDTEIAIAKLASLGHTNAEIADELHYSYNYIKKVTAVIFEKLCISKRNELRRFLL